MNLYDTLRVYDSSKYRVANLDGVNPDPTYKKKNPDPAVKKNPDPYLTLQKGSIYIF